MSHAISQKIDGDDETFDKIQQSERVKNLTPPDDNLCNNMTLSLDLNDPINSSLSQELARCSFDQVFDIPVNANSSIHQQCTKITDISIPDMQLSSQFPRSHEASPERPSINFPPMDSDVTDTQLLSMQIGNEGGQNLSDTTSDEVNQRVTETNHVADIRVSNMTTTKPVEDSATHCNNVLPAGKLNDGTGPGPHGETTIENDRMLLLSSQQGTSDPQNEAPKERGILNDVNDNLFLLSSCPGKRTGKTTQFKEEDFDHDVYTTKKTGLVTSHPVKWSISLEHYIDTSDLVKCRWRYKKSNEGCYTEANLLLFYDKTKKIEIKSLIPYGGDHSARRHVQGVDLKRVSKSTRPLQDS